MITKVRDWAMIGMMALTELKDEFGNSHLVQTYMNAPGADHESEVSGWTVTMETNQSNFVKNLKANGWTDAEIDALKK
jgi:hypothetical protein